MAETFAYLEGKIVIKRFHIGASAGKPFEIDEEYVTQATAVLGRRGAGKTNTAVVAAEELLHRGFQIVALDPLDVWWGLRSTREGAASGYPVVVFGGQHEDLPLHATTGARIADFTVEKRIPAVLSLRHLSKNDQRRFVTDFCERLYDRKRPGEHDDPLHLFIDEADCFIPQKVFSGQERMVGAVDQLVRRGRVSGIGVTLISQRPQVIHKDVLTQTELLIAHQLTGPQDRKALQAWVEAHDDANHGPEFMRSIAGLKRGQAWFWSPAWLDVFARVDVRQRKTFDSSATPKRGEKVKAPKELTRVDIEALKTQLADVVQEAEANDPAKLKAQIRVLEKQLADAGKMKPVDEAAVMERLNAELRPQLDRIAQIAAAERDAFWKEGFTKSIQAVHAAVDMIAEKFLGTAPPPYTAPSTSSAKAWPKRLAESKTSPPRETKRPKPETDGTNGTILSNPQRRVLTAIAQYPSGCAKRKAALIADYAVKGGAFGNLLSSLRTAGFIEGSGVLRATEAGLDALGEFSALPSGADLVDHWLGKVGKCAREILRVLIAAHPHGLSKQEIAERTETGYEAKGGAFGNSLSELRTLELIEGRGDAIRASDVFFED